MYFYEFIGEDYKKWVGGDSVFISAPTGVGKTTFVLHQLVDEARRYGYEVLFLSNRFVLKEQVKTEVAQMQGLPKDEFDMTIIEEFEGITILSYQSLQNRVRKQRYTEYLKSRYRYIVFDEAHYIMEDSLFNPGIVYILQFIKKCMGKTKIFLSATIDEVQKFLVENDYIGQFLFDVTLKVREGVYNNCLDTYCGRAIGYYKCLWTYKMPEIKKNLNIRYFDDYNDLIKIINQDSQKWLIFVSNKEKVREWKHNLKVPYAVVAADDKPSDVVTDIIKNEKFKVQVLITTKLLDNGINFNDSALKNVVIDTVSETEFIQMLGRKRLSYENEKFNLFIMKKSRKYFSGCLFEIRKNIKMFQSVITVDEILRDSDMYNKAKKFYVYQDDLMKLNPAAEAKVSALAGFLEDMQKAMIDDEWAFVKKQLSWLGEEKSFSETNFIGYQERTKNLSELGQWLKTICSKKMHKDEWQKFRQNLSQKCKLCKLSLGQPGLLAGRKCINDFFVKNGWPYEIQTFYDKHKSQNTYWILTERSKE